MKQALLLLILSIQLATAQTPVTREQMQSPQRVSKQQLEAGYQSAANGWVVHSGDSLRLGRGSMPDKRFAFICGRWPTFVRNVPSARSEQLNNSCSYDR